MSLTVVLVLLVVGVVLAVGAPASANAAAGRLARPPSVPARPAAPGGRPGFRGAVLGSPAGSWATGLADRSRAALGVAVGPLRTRRAEGRLVDVLDALAASLRSGSTPRRAVEEAAGGAAEPFATDLALVARALAHGDPLEDALARWVERRPLPGVRLTVAALGLGSRTGGDLARAVEEVAATERHRRATREEVHALSAQARLSALVVALAPVAFTALATVTDPGVARFLLATPAGWLCLAVGGGLDAAGICWMRSITARVA